MEMHRTALRHTDARELALRAIWNGIVHPRHAAAMTQTSAQPNVLAAPPRTDFSPAFWLLVALTGAGSGLAAGLLMKLLRIVQHMAWSYRDGTFLEAVDKAPNATRLLVLAGTGILVASVLLVLSRFKAGKPSGLEASIWFNDGRLPVGMTIAKAILSIVIVGLGASLGRESAPKQIGSLIGGLLARTRRLTASKRRLLAACGAGAGIAAVYNMPFGGALFAMEVLLGTLSLPLIAPAFLATLLGTATGWLMLPNEPTYQIPAMSLTFGLATWALVFAPIAGVGSALFVKAIAGVAAMQPKGFVVFPAALIVFTGLGLLAIPYPQLLGNGKDVVELAALDKILVPTLVALMILKPLVTVACLGTGAPGGLFTPSLAFGALLGGVCGHAWLLAWPDTPAGAFVLVGAGAVLAATTKGPISALVMMMELTHHIDGLMVPMLIAITGAVTIAHRIDPRSTYTGRLGAAAAFASDKGTAIVSTATRYSELLRLALSHGDTLAVVDDTGKRVGDLTPSDIAHQAIHVAPIEIATAIDLLEVKNANA